MSIYSTTTSPARKPGRNTYFVISNPPALPKPEIPEGKSTIISLLSPKRPCNLTLKGSASGQPLLSQWLAIETAISTPVQV